MDKPGSAFEINVFINCPFDATYKPLLRAMLFTLIHCGLVPRLADERADSGEVRLIKILDLMKESKFSIHDICRISALRPGDLPRFNMPFEFGLDYGCKEVGSKPLTDKKFLVLEKDRYQYQKVLSDIAGNDIAAHGGRPLRLVLELREWIRRTLGDHIPGGMAIWSAYNKFYSGFDEKMTEERRTKAEIRRISNTEFMYYIQLLSEPAVRRKATRRNCRSSSRTSESAK